MRNWLVGFMVFWTLAAIALSALAGFIYLEFCILPTWIAWILGLFVAGNAFMASNFAELGKAIRDEN